MSVQNVLLGSGNGNKEIDLIDLAALVLVPIAASMLFGVFTLSIDVFGGYDFTEPLWTIAGADISVSLLIVVLGVAWIVSTNVANQKTDMGEYELIGVVLALLLPVLYVFVPTVAELVNWHDLMRLAGTLWTAAAAVYVSYIG